MERFNRRVLSWIIFVASDLLALGVAFSLAFYSRYLTGLLFASPYDVAISITALCERWWWMPLLFIYLIFLEKLYERRIPFWDEAKLLIKAVTLAVLVTLAVSAMERKPELLSRMTLILLWGYSLFLLPISRLLIKRVLYRIGVWQENIIIIGAGEQGIRAAQALCKEVHLGYRVVGFLDDNEELAGKTITVENKEYKIFGKVDKFRRFVKFMRVSTIMIAVPSISKRRLANIVSKVQRYTKNILFVPDIKGIALINTELSHLFMEQMFMLNINNNLKSTSTRAFKVFFDIVMSIFLMPFIFMLILFIGIMIKMDSPGPVFYTHKRVGWGGKLIGVYKFRTMYMDAGQRLAHLLHADEKAKEEWETFFKLKDDPRVTRVGNFLRKTSLDELPQIFNILKKEMSFVGPRPVLQEEINRYYGANAEYYLLVRPGITGLWQVSGRNNTSYDYRVSLDTWYVLNWSMWLDVVIMLKTLKVVIKREGAY
jgi:undecaprenyl-phosphate galactose phosphotransferase